MTIHATTIALACFVVLVGGCSSDESVTPVVPDAAVARDTGVTSDLQMRADSAVDAAPDSAIDAAVAVDSAADTSPDDASVIDAAQTGGCASRSAVVGGMQPVVTEVSISNLVPGLYTDYLTGDVAVGGDILAVGAPNESTDLDSDHAGVMVFRWDGADWSLEEELLANVNFDPEQALGRWVEVSSTGDTVLAGGMRTVFIFRYVGGLWIGGGALPAPFEDDLISDVVVTDTHAAVGFYPRSGRSGAVVIYRLEGNAWVEEQTISDPRFDSSSGTAVGLDGSWLAIAARRQFDDVSYVFERQGTTWVETQEVVGARDADIDGTHLLTRSRVTSGGNIVTTLQVHELGSAGWELCETIPCNNECDASTRAGRIAHSGAPAQAGDQFGELLRFDGTDWVEDYVADVDGGAADISDRFAVMRQATGPQIRVLRFAP